MRFAAPNGLVHYLEVGARFADLLRSMSYETVDPPVLRPGWASLDPPVYVLSDGDVLARKSDRDRLALCGPAVTLDRAAQERWTREVAARLTGNPLALFVVCATFAAPLLKVVRAESLAFPGSAGAARLAPARLAQLVGDAGKH